LLGRRAARGSLAKPAREPKLARAPKEHSQV
jgi:hypothetical protein